MTARIWRGDDESTLIEMTTVRLPDRTRSPVTLAWTDNREALIAGAALELTEVPDVDLVHEPIAVVVPEQVPAVVFHVAPTQAVSTTVVVPSKAEPDNVTV